MIKKIIRILIGLLGAALGTAIYITLADLLPNVFNNFSNYKYIITIVVALVFGIIFYAVAQLIMAKAMDGIKLLDKEISKYPQSDILLGTIGLIVGLVIAYLIVSGIGTFINIPIITAIIGILVYVFMGYVGIRIALKSREDLFNLNRLSRLTSSLNKEKASKKNIIENKIPPKVLDTSVIIDGRIADICKTGFIEGSLVIPRFVLNELQHIADSSDDLKRVRGRRGLDILNAIQKEMDIEVEISDVDFEDIPEVDSKLLKLAQTINGKVVTNDFNLNKVAQFQGVEVLNINELANAVKPVAIPGEHMLAQVVKEGKEQNQGIAYLDDGTMIVVDGGKKYIGETITVLVTSVLQTPAGRMIFGKPKN